MTETIYVITHYAFNHTEQKKLASPLHQDFLTSDRNFVFYLIDEKCPDILKNKKIIREKKIDPLLAIAGKNHLSEWAFLLAEEKHAFCDYPFFMISSRFYEKNTWLQTTLSDEWERIFGMFKQYRFGFLPSYDRPLRWIDLDWKEKLKKEVWRYSYFPWKEKAFQLVRDLYDVKIPQEYRFVSDLQCHYIGFRDREALLDYVNFYRLLIDYFFDEEFHLVQDIGTYVRRTNSFRNEKGLTLLLEILSHLYFFNYDEKVFAFHYNGYYEIDERNHSFKKIIPVKIPTLKRAEQLLRWNWRRLKSEGFLAKWYSTRNPIFQELT